jgi:exodeoxyribonuclease VII large subunit
VQIECRSLEPLGVGDLQMAFEALKRKLYELGWFDAERKRPLPRFPRTIGVVTSQTGAAIRDVLATLARRMPACEVVLRPTLVQGEGAAEDIAQAIHELNQSHRNVPDVLIVGRGGGSIEDLWAFNTEIVAEAIVQSRIPIISAVGHEIDFTIADFVADVRAATPTAAAELAVRDANELLATLRGTQDLLGRLAFTQLSELQQRVERARTHTGFRSVMERIRLHTQRTDDFKSRMDAALQRSITANNEKVKGLEHHLASLHPLAPLKRGFAMLHRNGIPLTADDMLQAGESIDIVREHERTSALVLSSESR